MKEGLKNITKKIWLPVCAFTLPVILIAISFAMSGVIPFGTKSYVFGDANGYYINYISYYKTILSGEHSIFYAFAKGMGSNVYGAASYDITSPYMLLFMFFEKKDFALCYSLAIILMGGLCGLCMERFCTDVYGKKASNLIFSSAYAMCGFAVVFNYNLLFMTGVMTMPLVIMGLRRLINGKSPLIYSLSIAYAVMTHLQMGFGVCSAALVCFIAMLACNWYRWQQRRRSIIIRFILSSLSGGLIAAIVWLPTIISLRGGRAGQINADDFEFTANSPFIDIFSRFFSTASSTDQIIDGLPAIFTGIFAVYLVVLYFRGNVADKRKKLSAAGVLIFYLLSFYLKGFANILQGFTHANWFHYRYSFVFSFFVIAIAAEAYSDIEKYSRKELNDSLLIVVVGTILIFEKEYDFIDSAYAALDLAFLCAMLLTMRYKTAFSVMLLLAITSVQLTINYEICNEKILSSWCMDSENYQSGVEALEPIIDKIKASDSEFYRIENEAPRVTNAGNDGMFFDYNGVGYSGNSERDFVADGVAALGLSRRAREVTFYDDGTPAAMDALFGIKYLISEHDLSDEKLYLDTGMGENIKRVFQNPYALPVCILSEGEITSVEMKDEDDIFKVQNTIWKSMTGEKDDIFTPQSNVSLVRDGESIRYMYTADRDGAAYVYDATGVGESYGSDKDVLKYVGYYSKGDYVSGLIDASDEADDVAYDGSIDRNVYIYYANEDKLWDYTNILLDRETSVEKVSDTRLKGSTRSNDGQRLFFTIPYDSGWSLYIDGRESKLTKCVDFLMASEPLSVGEHTYELKYTLPGLKAGIMAFLGGILMLFVLIVKTEKSVYN